MTATATRVSHPLDRLTAAEIDVARQILHDAALLGPTVRVPLLALEEPAKDVVQRHRAGDPVERRVQVVLLDTADGASSVVLLSLDAMAVESVTALDPAIDGQPPLMAEEFMAVEEIVRADEGWCAAMAARGITDVSRVRACPLSAGDFDLPDEAGKRLVRVLSFRQDHERDHPWAHPIDGVVAYVDLIERKVVELIDHEQLPIPEEPGNFDDPQEVGPFRTTQRPISVTQPEGPSFTVEGDAVSWEGWTFRVGFDPREGLVLHQVRIQDRPVVYRASIAEMVVPYADPSPVRYWQNYFDVGEYLLGQQVNELELGCDCVGEIHYFDAVLANSLGEPEVRRSAICMHEEDAGVLWKHTDLYSGSQETRRQRRLVISFWATIGNYDYGFYWYLYLDGRIELEVKASGVVFTSHYNRDKGSPWATEVAPGLGAPLHQHLFCARLDMSVDGVANAVDELDVVSDAPGESNPFGNAFRQVTHRLHRESEAAREADGSRSRTWRISSAEQRNRLGVPTAYDLRPQAAPPLLAGEGSSIRRRAAFATRQLWVTRYHPDERYPAGAFVNQHPGDAGLPQWIAADREIDGQDVVVWHTFGVTHVPRPEDWPVMPVDTCGFELRPAGFFDRNPTLDVPSSATTCHPAR